jgi:RNA polymerase-binding transcription factor
MDPSVLKQFGDQLQHERRALVRELSHNEEGLEAITETGREEFEEQAQRQRDAFILESLDERAQNRLQEIDAALARIEAGTFGQCENCEEMIPEQTLRSDPTARSCPQCPEQNERGHVSSAPGSEAETEIIPDRGELPPDLAILDDDELQEHLHELVRSDGRVDAEELQIQARNSVIYLEGALPSEPEHQILLNILTDVAGIRDIVDHLEIEPLAWERTDRSKEEDAGEVLPGTIPNQEPYGGTDDIHLAKEEGVDYEPPDAPPPPPRKPS